MVRVLTEPKNALTKQYERLFAMEEADLRFTSEALQSIAKKARARETGARGLRSILEEVMLDVMYDLPSLTNVKKCIINKEVIDGGQQPVLIPTGQTKDVPA